MNATSALDAAGFRMSEKRFATPVSPPGGDDSKKSIGAKAAARLIGCDPRTVKRWAREGRIPMGPPGPEGEMRFVRDTIQKFAAAYRRRRYGNDQETSARLEAAVFECFDQRMPLAEIVKLLGVPAAYVFELFEVRSRGLPYEHPTSGVMPVAGAARPPTTPPPAPPLPPHGMTPRDLREAKREAKRIADEDEARVRDVERESRERREAEEREHAAYLERMRAAADDARKGRSS